MRFEVEVECHYPHAIVDVWDGITTNEGISDWLMETANFKPEVGHRFEMTCIDESGNLEFYRCQVLEIEPPNRMAWSWVIAGKEAEGLTEVEFRLKQTETGTTLTLLHRGDRDKATIDRFKAGWPYKLDRLAEFLAHIKRRGT
jgi:uncharacterized protein YndB with AHSA1/START domain